MYSLRLQLQQSSSDVIASPGVSSVSDTIRESSRDYGIGILYISSRYLFHTRAQN